MPSISYFGQQKELWPVISYIRKGAVAPIQEDTRHKIRDIDRYSQAPTLITLFVAESQPIPDGQ